MLRPISAASPRLTQIVAFLISVALTGCAAASKKDDSALQSQVTELKSTIATLNSRIDSMDSKLSALNTKGTEAAKSTEPKAAVQKAKPTAVTSHPADGVGAEVPTVASERDPDAGFVNDEAVRSYRKAMILFHSGKYAEAVLAYSGFLEKFPDHALAGSAQYYIGRSYFEQKEYKLALQEYQRVLTSYDRSSRVPETLRDMASIEDNQKDTQAAARHRQLLTSLFPQSPAAGSKESPQAAAPQNPSAQPDAADIAETSTSSGEESSGGLRPVPAGPGGIDEPPVPTAPLAKKPAKAIPNIPDESDNTDGNSE